MLRFYFNHLVFKHRNINEVNSRLVGAFTDYYLPTSLRLQNNMAGFPDYSATNR